MIRVMGLRFKLSSLSKWGWMYTGCFTLVCGIVRGRRPVFSVLSFFKSSSVLLIAVMKQRISNIWTLTKYGWLDMMNVIMYMCRRLYRHHTPVSLSMSSVLLLSAQEAQKSRLASVWACSVAFSDPLLKLCVSPAPFSAVHSVLLYTIIALYINKGCIGCSNNFLFVIDEWK